jgi:hypothetical protein
VGGAAAGKTAQPTGPSSTRLLQDRTGGSTNHLPSHEIAPPAILHELRTDSKRHPRRTEPTEPTQHLLTEANSLAPADLELVREGRSRHGH